jgi:hypothetical protein
MKQGQDNQSCNEARVDKEVCNEVGHDNDVCNKGMVKHGHKVVKDKIEEGQVQRRTSSPRGWCKFT